MVWLESDETACLEKKLNDLPTQIVQNAIIHENVFLNTCLL